MNNIYRFALLTIISVTLAQGAALAKNFKGRVTAVSNDSFQMTTPDPETREILVVRIAAGPNTKMDGVNSLQELSVGSRVKVEASEGPGGSWQANHVGVGDVSSTFSGPSTGGAAAAETLAAQQGEPTLE